MSEFDTRHLLTRAFRRLRRQGFVLGVSELLAALEAVDGGWGANDIGELSQLAQLLWCKSGDDKRVFAQEWAAVLDTVGIENTGSGMRQITPEGKPPHTSRKREEDVDPGQPPTEAIRPMRQNSPTWSTLPVRAPLNTIETDDAVDLQTYWPVSRRHMVYSWRYLRRPAPDGPPDLLDVRATVDQVARQGFYLGPIYRRRERNHAHLVLLIDQDGSMAPFHRLNRDLVETARQESDIEQVDLFYFHNVPTERLYLDPHLTQSVPRRMMLAQCTGDSSVLVVSDAGAARGYRRFERIRATTEFLFELRQQSSLIAWLNPMPRDRWVSASAQVIAQMAPMFPMSPDGFSNAIDVVRGQPLAR